ncbi:MAG: hypothetical protein GQ570_15365 [Helicobacteraceae bacterium]|nr:hypothetical protein [Helicobacteraceae bacterium]
MKQFILLTFLLTSLSAKEFTFAQAWQKFQEKDFSLKQKEHALSRTKNLKDATSSLYLPSVSFNAEYAHLNDAVSFDIMRLKPISDLEPLLKDLGLSDAPFTTDISKEYIFTSTIDMKWALFTGGRRGAIVDIAKFEVDEATSLKGITKDKLFVELVELYYGVVMLESLEATLGKIESSSLTHYENTQKMLEQGQVAKIEVLSSKVAFNNSKIARKRVSYSLKSAKNALNKALKEIEVTPTSKMFVDRNFKTIDEYLNDTTNNSLAIKAITARQNQAKSNITLKEGSYYPEVFAFGNKFLYKDDSVMMDLVPDWSVGVGLKVDILSMQGRSQRVQASRNLLLEASFLKAELKEDLNILCEKVYNDLLSSYDSYEELEATEELARENYKLREEAFRNGLQTSNDVNDALTLIAEASTARLYSSYKFVKNLAMLLTLSGNLENFKGLK